MSRLARLVQALKKLLKVAAAVAAVAALIAFFVGGPTYAGSSSGYCASCHSDQAHPERGGHGDVACQQCHEESPAGNSAMFRGWLFGSDDMPAHGATDEASCESCHSAATDRWEELLESPGHEVHRAPEAEAPCTRCHSGSLHGDPSPEEGCLSCHSEVPLLSEPRAEADCVACHIFASGGMEAVRREVSAPGPVSVEDVHGAPECSSCHNPHRAQTGAEIDCLQCHRGPLRAAATADPEGHRRCQGCHLLHAPREEPVRPCTTCHRPREEPSAEGAWQVVLPEDGADPPPAIDPAQLPPEQWAHAGECQNCHQPHTWIASMQRCAECHEDQVTELSGLPEGVHPSCDSCHAPHASRPNAALCRSCHRNKLQGGRRLPVRHRDCLSCHAAHQPRPTFGRACAECHQAQVRSVAHGPARHRQCANCHRPHEPPLARAAQACGRCHTPMQQSLSRPGTPRPHRRCSSCHSPHAGPGRTPLSACASCHSMVRARGANHRDKCTDCHSLHAGMEGRSLACSSCHSDIQIRLGRNVQRHQCQSCHLPHRGAARALQQCMSCHTRQGRVASTWPSSSAHAGPCTGCHQPHSDPPTATCRSCHQGKANQTHMGPHRDCAGCHAPHQPRPGGQRGWWTRCSSCHEAEGRAVAAAGASHPHGRCENCHDRPGRAPPTCQSCHNRTLPRLHSVPRHNNCTSCHSKHGTRAPARRQCTGSCHEDRRDHFTDAPSCQSCHEFRN